MSEEEELKKYYRVNGRVYKTYTEEEFFNKLDAIKKCDGIETQVEVLEELPFEEWKAIGDKLMYLDDYYESDHVNCLDLVKVIETKKLSEFT